MAKPKKDIKKRETEKDTAKDQARAQFDNILEMVQALEKSGDDQDGAALVRIHESPLSVEVRGNWHAPGENDPNVTASAVEYKILLCWGGPAVRIVGELSKHNEPESARLEYQDWGALWTQYHLTDEEETVLMAYAQQFYFGE